VLGPTTNRLRSFEETNQDRKLRLIPELFISELIEFRLSERKVNECLIVLQVRKHSLFTNTKDFVWGMIGGRSLFVSLAVNL
jgi:hypothetical protein